MVHNVNDNSHQNLWYLDTGCSNHMIRDKKVFSHELDESFCNTVKFGNNLVVSVMGKGRVTLCTKENSSRIMSNVLYVLVLQTNLFTS